MVTEKAIRRAADSRSFERGRAYFASGRVRRLTVDGVIAKATVKGISPYRVKLTPDSRVRSLAATAQLRFGRPRPQAAATTFIAQFLVEARA